MRNYIRDVSICEQCVVSLLLESYDFFFFRSGISFIDQEQYYNQTQCNAARMTGPGATHPSHTH